MSTNPRDNPSVNFEEDPNVPYLLTRTGNRYGIVLVANWPPDESLTIPYQRFVSLVQTCFRSEDIEFGNEEDGKNQCPAVYLYPPEFLHITIATFTPFTSSSPNDQASFSAACSKIMASCFARDDWPTGNNNQQQKIHIEIDRTQIGSKAGILLWENKDGMINRIRQIIKEEYDNFTRANPGALEGRKLIVPGIIHSTFLRFGRVPVTKGELVQQKYAEVCGTETVRELFGELEIKSLKLVIEQIPYMHIPCDEDHVLVSYSFEKDS